MVPEILTASGERFNYLNPIISSIKIDDIASALSKACRFSGHCKGHYSVAQHSVLVSEMVRPEYALYGLLHDASEAYTGDMNKPLKTLVGSAFRDVEDRVQAAIYNKFGLSAAEPHEVHESDMILLMTEKRDLMHPYTVRCESEHGYEPLEHTIVGMEREEALIYFMNRFNELTGD